MDTEDDFLGLTRDEVESCLVEFLQRTHGMQIKADEYARFASTVGDLMDAGAVGITPIIDFLADVTCLEALAGGRHTDNVSERQASIGKDAEHIDEPWPQDDDFGDFKASDGIITVAYGNASTRTVPKNELQPALPRAVERDKLSDNDKRFDPGEV